VLVITWFPSSATFDVRCPDLALTAWWCWWHAGHHIAAQQYRDVAAKAVRADDIHDDLRLFGRYRR
jgi:hypothetical protein